MTTRILCIRHGETEWNTIGRWQGHAPVPLNEVGQDQARKLARYLAGDAARNGTVLDAIYSSDLARAMQTAANIAEALNLPVQPDPQLREIDLGDWQGLMPEEVAAWDPDRFAAHTADRYNVPTPNGESRNQLMIRARAAFDAITARHPGVTVAVVTHGGTVGMLIESLFGRIECPSLSNTSITTIEQAESGAPWRLVNVAWTPHLDGSPIGGTW
jgi:broad specificity phosphatase PhoE